MDSRGLKYHVDQTHLVLWLGASWYYIKNVTGKKRSSQFGMNFRISKENGFSAFFSSNKERFLKDSDSTASFLLLIAMIRESI